MSGKTESTDPGCMEIWGGYERTEKSISVTGFDVWISSNPYHNSPLGGDIYYISSCGAARISRFSLMDISGHGPGVSKSAKCLRTLMRKNVNTSDQTRFARKLNDDFGMFSKEGIFATALLTAYDAVTDNLKICNAGHPRPLLYRKHKDTWNVLDESLEDCAGRIWNIPLGVHSESSYRQFEISLMSGDIVLMFTDAVIELPDSTGMPIGEEGLLSLLEDIPKMIQKPSVPPWSKSSPACHYRVMT
jgi:sigma-B regulation protein RsbU (phosphoserine phosphatase)